MINVMLMVRKNCMPGTVEIYSTSQKFLAYTLNMKYEFKALKFTGLEPLAMKTVIGIGVHSVHSGVDVHDCRTMEILHAEMN